MSNSKAAKKGAAASDYKEPTPEAFLEVRARKIDVSPSLFALCVGYESGEWRARQLVAHMMEWLPDFALTYEERRSFGTQNAVRRMRKAAKTIYKTEKFAKRGEFGELLLHIAIRQIFETVPAVSKIYYKDSSNDTVKGFDAVHVVVTPSNLELWLGEAKFYDNISRAITDVVKELDAHTGTGFLRDEFIAITNKIDTRWPHADRLKKLIDPNTSIDGIFDAVCIPVLLTYDSPTVAGHDSVCAKYVEEFKTEVMKNHGSFCGKHLPPLRIHLFLLPLKSKSKLVEALDEELKAWQKV